MTHFVLAVWHRISEKEGSVDVFAGCWRWPGVVAGDISQPKTTQKALGDAAPPQEPSRFALRLPRIHLLPGQLLLVKGPVGSGAALMPLHNSLFMRYLKSFCRKIIFLVGPASRHDGRRRGLQQPGSPQRSCTCLLHSTDSNYVTAR